MEQADVSFDGLVPAASARCINCRYFIPEDGTCRVHPPLPVSTNGNHITYVYSVVTDSSTQWCAEGRTK